MGKPEIYQARNWGPVLGRKTVFWCLTHPCPQRGGVWHEAMVSVCSPLVAAMGLSPLLIPTPCGPERVLVVSMEPLDDLSCLTTLGVGRPGDGAVARAVDQGHPDAHSESVRGLVRAGVCICGIISLTGAYNNHNESGGGGGQSNWPAPIALHDWRQIARTPGSPPYRRPALGLVRPCSALGWAQPAFVAPVILLAAGAPQNPRPTTRHSPLPHTLQTERPTKLP